MHPGKESWIAESKSQAPLDRKGCSERASKARIGLDGFMVLSEEEPRDSTMVHVVVKRPKKSRGETVGLNRRGRRDKDLKSHR
jgi:hypothetical protein